MKNTYFEAMKVQAEAYAEEKAAREAVKKTLIARYREASRSRMRSSTGMGWSPSGRTFQQ